MAVDLDCMASVYFKILCLDFAKNEAQDNVVKGSKTYPFTLPVAALHSQSVSSLDAEYEMHELAKETSLLC